jgi:hypothetical protein
MAEVTIAGLGPIDGTYPLALEFNYRDYRDIKKIAGVRANEVFEALEGGDLDIFVALASIALRRAGVRHDPDTLLDLEIGGITIDFGEDEAEVVEDPQTSGDGTPSDTSAVASGNGTSPATDTSQETLTLESSGTPQPASTSDPETSTT